MKISAIRRRDLLNFYADITAPDENGKRITRSTLQNVITTINLWMAAGHTDIRTTNGYCRAEKCDEIDVEILEKARIYGQNKEQVMGIEDVFGSENPVNTRRNAHPL